MSEVTEHPLPPPKDGRYLVALHLEINDEARMSYYIPAGSSEYSAAGLLSQVHEVCRAAMNLVTVGHMIAEARFSDRWGVQL